MTHDEMIAVIKAAKQKRPIQAAPNGTSDWFDLDGEPIWNFGHWDFRVKPPPREPRRIWVNVHPHGHYGPGYPSRQCADYHASHDRIECVQFVEVLP